MKLKTLEDIGKSYLSYLVPKAAVKKEAIKWVKWDLKQLENCRVDNKTIILRWMKRLNITEEDLKDEI